MKLWSACRPPPLKIGDILNAAGHLDEVEASLRRTLEIGPGYYHALMVLGRLLGPRVDCEDAVEMFRSAESGQPPQAAVYAALAEEVASLGRREEAVAAFDAMATHSNES